VALLHSDTSPMLFMHGFSACYPSFFPGGVAFSNVTVGGVSAPLSNQSFFSTANYNIAPFCGSGGLKVPFNGVVKFKN
jgi:hypothetical protein